MTAPRLVRASNPGPFTLEGTNTWVIGEGPTVVIDPGPDDLAHLTAVAEAAGAVAAILVTHHHPDHAPGAARLSDLTGAPVRAFAPGAGERALGDGDTVTAGDTVLRAMHTPGHTSDHVVFHEPREGALFTGDAVLGQGTSVIDPPEGDLRAYLRSLEAMLTLKPRVLYPGHGPVVRDAEAKLREYLNHRAARERQVMEGLRDGPKTPEELVPGIYAAYPEALFPAAARSILAHLIKLEQEGRARRIGGAQDDRFAQA